MPRDIHNIYVEFYTSGDINTARLPVTTCKYVLCASIYMIEHSGVTEVDGALSHFLWWGPLCPD